MFLASFLFQYEIVFMKSHLLTEERKWRGKGGVGYE